MMRFTALLAAFIYALPALAATPNNGEVISEGEGVSSTVPVISTSPVQTIVGSPTVNAPIASGSVIQLSTAPASPTSASGAPPTPTNVFQFAKPDNVTICNALTFEWSYVNAVEIPMTLVVTNQQGLLPLNLEPVDTPLVSQTLTNDISSNSGLFVWQSADVPIGAYVVVAFSTEFSFSDPIIASRSLPFYVRPGLDESCLNNTGWFTPTSTADGSAPTSLSGSSEVLTTKKSMSPGAIAGTVIGVVGGVALLAAAALFYRYRSKRIERHRGSQEGPYNKF